MTDSSNGGVGGVGGVGGSSGASRAGAATAADANGPTADDVANAMVDAVSGPTGIDTDTLGAAIAGIQAANPAFGTAVQASVDAQLSAVDAGRLQGAIDAAALGQPSLTQQVMTIDLPSVPDVRTVNPTYSYTAQGQLVDACGNPVATLQAPDSRQAAMTKALVEYDDHAQKITGGTISGPLYNGAYLMGADEATRNAIHAVGTLADGWAKPLESKAKTMHIPLDR